MHRGNLLEVDYACRMKRGPDTASLYLAIDQGGHASRALVFDTTGEVVSSAEIAVETQRPQPFWVEHDAVQLLVSVRTAVHDALAALGIDAQRVTTAGLATQRSSIVCWNRSTGAPLSPVLSWQDTRAAAWLHHFAPRAMDVRQRTGLRLSPHYGASKLRWCMDHLPAVQQAYASGELRCGPLASYLTSGLTAATTSAAPGRSFADPANASRTLLWNFVAREWDAELLAWFDIPRTVLPESVPTRYAFGSLAHNALRIPLSLVTGDQSAALFALGPPRDDVVYVNLGTGAFIQHLCETGTRDHPALLRSVAYADSQRALYALEGTVNGAGSALSWFAEREGLAQEDIDLHRWLAAAGSIPVFINTVGGLGSPFWISRIEPHFIGSGNLEARGRAVVESILFLVAANLEAFRVAGIVPCELVVSGGLTQSDALCQGLADVCRIPVCRPRFSEATARGVVQLLSAFSLPPPTQPQRYKPRPNPECIGRQTVWRHTLERMSNPLPSA